MIPYCVIEAIAKGIARADGFIEYRSWAPEEYWESLDPGVVEYNSWGFK